MKKKKEFIQFKIEFEEQDVLYNKIQMSKIKSKKRRPTQEQIKKRWKASPTPPKEGLKN